MKFWFKGYKRFNNWTEFSLKKITILTGENNSGKSSITQLLNVIYYSFNQSVIPNLILNTDIYKLGNENNVYNYEDKKGIFQIAFQTESSSILLYTYKKDTGNMPFLTLKCIDYYLYGSKEKITPIVSLEIDDYSKKIRFDELQVLYFLKNTANEDINDYNIRQEEDFKKEKDLSVEIEKLEEELFNHIDAGGSENDIEYIEKLKQKKLLEEQKKLEQTKTINNIKINEYLPLNNCNIDFFDQVKSLVNPVSEVEIDFIIKDFEDEENNVRNEYIEHLSNSFKKSNSKFKNYFEFESAIIYDIIEFFITDLISIKELITKKYLNYSSSIMKLRKRAFSEYDAHIKYFRTLNKYSKEEKDVFNKKISKFLNIFDKEFIDTKIDIEVIEGVIYKLLINNKNISDYGDGLKNIISILLPILIDEKEKQEQQNFIIEEPEIRLHPKTQSLLADLFVELSKEHEFIIETHSEYLIRQFQYLVLDKKINLTDIVIYYIRENRKIETLKIGKNGILDGEFGSGFIDEAGRLIYKILKKQKEQKLKDING